MKDVIIKFETVGNCFFNVPLLCEKWDDKCSISLWDSSEKKFTFHYSKKGKEMKAQISEDQAYEVIKSLDLIQVFDSVFKSGSLFISKQRAAAEMIKLDEERTELWLKIDALTAQKTQLASAIQSHLKPA